MQIIKNKSANRCPLHLCLLIAFTFYFVGCDSPDTGTDVPSKNKTPAADKDISDPEIKSSVSGEENDDASAPDGSPAKESPKPPAPADGNNNNLEGDSNSKSNDAPDDSPGPSLTAPKSVSMSPDSGRGQSSTTTSSPAGSEENAALAIRFLSWNVESDGADPDVICEQLSKLNKDDRYDVVGLTEVDPPDWKKFRSALGKPLSV